MSDRREVTVQTPDGRELTVVAVPTLFPLRTESEPDLLTNPLGLPLWIVWNLVRKAARPRWKVGVLQPTWSWGAPKIIARTVLPPRVAPDELMEQWARDIEQGRIPTA